MNKKLLRKEIGDFQQTQIKDMYSNLNFTIILIQPEHAGNIGFIARIMKNFNFTKLIIFNPIEKIEEIHSYSTQGFAMKAKDVLKSAKIITIQNQSQHLIQFQHLMKDFDFIIGTTAKGQHYRNVRRISIFPENIEFPISQKPLKIAIIFGRESRGLTNEELEYVDLLVRIPTSDEYPTLNLSHACGIILYEIFKKVNQVSLGRGESPILVATREDRDTLYKILNNLIIKLKIRTHRKENVLLAFRNVFERAIITKKELSLILGLFSKIESILKKKILFEK